MLEEGRDAMKLKAVSQYVRTLLQDIPENAGKEMLQEILRDQVIALNEGKDLSDYRKVPKLVSGIFKEATALYLQEIRSGVEESALSKLIVSSAKRADGFNGRDNTGKES